MQFTKEKHLLSNTIMTVAIVNVLMETAYCVSRVIIMKTGDIRYPDMLNNRVWYVNIILFLLQLITNSVVFFRSQIIISSERKLTEYDKNTLEMPARNSHEAKQIVELDVGITELLLKIWALILLGVSCVYEITSVVYKNFINSIIAIIGVNTTEKANLLKSIYNGTHGFKYMGMVIAIFIGIGITSICLKDKFMMYISAEVIIAFLLAFLLVEQTSVVILSKQVGVVWTSVIYHCIQTLGLLSLAIYLRRKYKGI